MLIYCIILFILFLLYFSGIKFPCKYSKTCKGQKNFLEVFYPSVAFWLSKTGFFKREAARKKIETYQMLYPGMDARKIYYLESLRRFSIIYSILSFISVLCIIFQLTDSVIKQDSIVIKRPAIGMAAEEQKVHVVLEQNKKSIEEELSVTVTSRNYSEQEKLQFQEEARNYVRKNVKGLNQSLNHVTRPLVLITDVPENPFSVNWYLDDLKLVNEDGSINNKELKDAVLTTIKACISYGEMEEYMEISLEIYPYEWSWSEKVKDSFLKSVQQMEQKDKEKEEIVLPKDMDGIQATYVGERKHTAKKLLLCTFLGCIGMWMYWEETVKRQKKKHDEACTLAYPSIVYKLTLLLGAGMTLKGAWQRIIKDYGKEKAKKPRETGYIYEEMIITWNEMESGVSELEAFSRFGKRMKLRPYLRFSSFISQNMKKGTKGILEQLEHEAREAQEERKQIARKLGEEAGTKMLFPMLIMLLIVLAIIMLPAFLSLSRGGI